MTKTSPSIHPIKLEGLSYQDYPIKNIQTLKKELSESVYSSLCQKEKMEIETKCVLKGRILFNLSYSWEINLDNKYSI